MTTTLLLIGCLVLLIPLLSAGKLNMLLKLPFLKRKPARDSLYVFSRKELLRANSGFEICFYFSVSKTC